MFGLGLCYSRDKARVSVSTPYRTQDDTPPEMNLRAGFLQKLTEGGRKWSLVENISTRSGRMDDASLRVVQLPHCREKIGLEHRPRVCVILPPWCDTYDEHQEFHKACQRGENEDEILVFFFSRTRVL